MDVVTLNYWLKVCDGGCQEVRGGPHETYISPNWFGADVHVCFH